MMVRYELREDQWDRIKDALPGKPSDPGRSGDDNRRFVEAVLWVGRNEGRWRSLPAELDKWNRVFQRFRRWAKNVIWQMIFNTLAVDADTEWLMIDSIIVRVHQHASGAKRGKKIKR